MNQTTKKSSTWKVLGFLFLILILPILWIMINKTGVHYSKKLPIYFDRELDSKGDTIYHTIENFKLIKILNQSNHNFELKLFGLKGYLVLMLVAKNQRKQKEQILSKMVL
jgi:hypothetical protein